MKELISYMDDLKEKYGSDYASAKALEISKVSVSLIRKRRQMSDETAIKIADLLEIDRNELLIAATIARSEGEVKTEWMNHAKKVGIAASLAGIMLLGEGVTHSAHAQAINDAESGMYIMSNCCKILAAGFLHGYGLYS